MQTRELARLAIGKGRRVLPHCGCPSIAFLPGFDTGAAPASFPDDPASTTAPTRNQDLPWNPVMPRGNGRELAGWLRRRSPRIRVLYLSGYAPDTVGREAILNPSVRLLPKPGSAAQLVSMAREVLSGSGAAGS